MAIPDVLYSVLVNGAGLIASGAATEFAKDAGRAAFEALKNRLANTHSVKSLALLDKARDNTAYETVIRTELARPEIEKDYEVRRLAEELLKIIDALPPSVQIPYAVDIKTINSGRNLLFDNVEGVTAETASSQQDITFKNVKAPPLGK